MKSIKTKLALFVSCLCIVLIGLVWLLTVVLFEPNYRSMIRTELNTKIAAVAAVLEGEQAEGADILSLISLVKPLMQSGICIEISATEKCIEAHGYTSPTLGTAVPAYRAFFVLEGIGDGCQLHPSSQGVLGDKTELDSTLAVAKRKETAIKGRLSETLVDLSSSPYRQQQVVGMVTSSGYIILASTNLERVDQAMQVVSHRVMASWVPATSPKSSTGGIQNARAVKSKMSSASDRMSLVVRLAAVPVALAGNSE